jgi:hypothetical protein
MKSVETSNSTLQTILIELVSAQSALNMPSPDMPNPEYVVHAYQHITAAIQQLASLEVTKSTQGIEQTSSDPNQIEVDLVSIMKDMGFQSPDPKLTSFVASQIKKEKSLEDLTNNFYGAPINSSTIYAINLRIKCFIQTLIDRGDLRNEQYLR